MLDNLIPCIIKDRRMVSSQSLAQTGEPVEPTDNREWLVTEYWNDGMMRQRNLDFARTFLPISEELKRKMQKVVGMKNPRPDYIYGLNPRKYVPSSSSPPTSDETENIRQISPGIHDPILLIEGKSDKGSAVEAENQACRGGAALVNAARLLRARIGEKDVKGADDRTFVFSGTLCPNSMEIWVHWAEVFDTEPPVYHMNSLEVGHLKADKFLSTFRGFFHNILDWGCIARYNNELKPFYDRIYAWERMQLALPPSSATKVVKSSSSTSRAAQSEGVAADGEMEDIEGNGSPAGAPKKKRPRTCDTNGKKAG